MESNFKSVQFFYTPCLNYNFLRVIAERKQKLMVLLMVLALLHINLMVLHNSSQYFSHPGKKSGCVLLLFLIHPLSSGVWCATKFAAVLIKGNLM